MKQAIESAKQLLPSQGPIRSFVSLNTLQAFEAEPFDSAVKRAFDLFRAQPYLAEERYHAKLARGRILPLDLAAVLLEDMGEDSTKLIGALGTRYHLRATMMEHPLRIVSDDELNWLLSESPLLFRFRPEADLVCRTRILEGTQHWIKRDFYPSVQGDETPLQPVVQGLLAKFNADKIEQWSERNWRAFTLHLLWQVCAAGVNSVPLASEKSPPPIRHRDLLLAATGIDIDRSVNDILIKFCAAFLDQGIAHWSLPDREQGFLYAFSELYKSSHPVESWLRALPAELRDLEQAGRSPQESIQDSLQKLGITGAEVGPYIERTLLAMRGWAGMLWQMESNAEWTVQPAPPGALEEYLAVRLILERLALGHFLRESLPEPISLKDSRRRLLDLVPPESTQLTPDQRTLIIFQLAQTLGWTPEDLNRLRPDEWRLLIREIEIFSSFERRRVYQLAYERRYRNQTLDAFVLHQASARPITQTPRFQMVCCIDEREESFRRHLEEAAPDCETFGMAGFFGVAMYYRGVADAHYAPLCPIVVKPKHYVQEEVVFSYEVSHRRRMATRRAIGKTSHWLHTGSRSVFGGAMMALLGPIASIPLVLRVLFPRLTAKIAELFTSMVRPPEMTRLLLERHEPTPGPTNGHIGYTFEEMLAITERMLRDIGLTENFSRLIFITGHGSASLNNPHRSAYDCGACGGGNGGPNARALAIMLNDPRIRERLAERGLNIPRQTYFVGSLHVTSNEVFHAFDLDRLPSSHQADFEYARKAIDKARTYDAHERCRRFESAELSISPEAALRHVEARSEDLSQVRPEYGHASNAACYVGRRWRTRGLYLDRRSFLASYDPTKDDAEAHILERIIQAVFPVCSGINLQYYFSHVDPTNYGCGSKLPHNIVSLLGVMDGAASDLRTGLPWQGVEIHEPVRILFILEIKPEQLLGILNRNVNLKNLVYNNWVQVAVLDPEGAHIQVFRDGEFHPYKPEEHELPVVHSSVEWYRGWRDNLGFASIIPGKSAKQTASVSN